MITNNPIYNDCYFSDGNGFEESKSVFVYTNKVHEAESLTVGELGFGTGLNLLATLSCFRGAEAAYYSVEKHPLPKAKIDGMISGYLQDFPEIYSPFLDNYGKLFCDIKRGFNSAVWQFGKTKVFFNLYFGDVLDFLSELDTKMDCWYLDGHSPEKNPDMWSKEVCRLLYDKSKTGTTLATYTAAGLVKQNLRAAGFFVKRMKGFGVKRHKLWGIR